ncbi:RagB/SusD family nutrient uptake outer membrane protein [Parabacteroides sp. OttesenSCG-928-G07]|nr:RagB/SusD family nutrient uptake outer membrane protein [Parabacteroides sp. OttesenSCG-928-G21]MDL2278429.1 RagB/SusD family nutrient uptake outer membrane protein [Parabacteroides sp. OttesenSCG-928-G07]
MKIKYLLIGIIAVLTAITSCSDDLLDIPRKGVMPQSDFYKTDEDAEAALAVVYRYLWNVTYSSNNGIYPFMKNIMSDDIYSGGLKRNDQALYEAINEFTFEAENPFVLSYFQLLYNFIYRCNLIIDNFSGDNLDTTTKKSAVAQAKVWRAWAYTELITLWGTPPLVDHCLTPDEYQQPNGNPEELWNLVVTDLTQALSSGDLPQKKSVNDAVANVTTGYAQALLGKAYVFMTYSLNGGALGGEQATAAVAKAQTSEYWSKAAEVFETLINSNMYALYDGPFVDILKNATNWSSENMYEFNRIFNASNTGTNLSAGFESYMIGWDNAAITAYGTIVPCNRASNFLTPRREAYDAMVAWQGADNDRMHGSIRTYEQLVNDMGVGVKNGIYTIYASDGVFDMKYFRDQNLDCITNHATEKNYPIMRYAEVLLLAAEANLMIGNQGKADQYMNQVRRRAGLADMSNITLSDLQQEKRCELYLEGTRSYDLIRWGLASTNMKDQGADIPYFSAYTEGATYDSEGNLVNLNSRSEGSVTVNGIAYTLGVQNQVINESGYGFKTGKHELLPFPQQEILLSGEIVGGPLKQNPGW